jgi:Zn-dependent peptidase ImmA (M78 family)
MGEKIKFDGKEYDPNNLSELAVSAVVSLQFISTRLTELKNMQALLTLTRVTCIEKIKSEILSEKAGIVLGDN